VPAKRAIFSVMGKRGTHSNGSSSDDVGGPPPKRRTTTREKKGEGSKIAYPILKEVLGETALLGRRPLTVKKTTFSFSACCGSR